ncbi:MAG: dethiobiotin synthetase [Solirubrobacteraceae bacterium]|nr:dethiobiotin synthetase [Solirubrobacteraceae bacterium]
MSGVPDLPSSVPGCLVTGTDTGVGKTVLAAAIVAALAARGWRVVAQKPVLSGLEDAAPGLPEEAVRGAPGDHELLGRCAGMEPEEVAPLRFGPPVSPHLAAELAGQTIDVPGIVARIGAIRADALIVEGVGGLLVPLASGWDVRRLAAALGLPVVIAARPGLGTINHTLLTLEAARRGGLNVRAVVLTPWPESPSVVQRSNRETIEKLGRVAVLTLERVDPLSPGPLARAGARLPLDALIARLGRPNSDRPAP